VTSHIVAGAVDAMFGGSVQMPYNIFLLGVGPILNASIFASVFLAQQKLFPRKLAAHIDFLRESGSEVYLLHLHTKNASCFS